MIKSNHKKFTFYVLFLSLFPLVSYSDTAFVDTNSYFKDTETLSDLSIYKQNDITLLSYHLNEERADLLSHVQTQLSEGRGVKVSHVLNIATEELDFDTDFDLQFLRYAKRDTVTGDIVCGETQNRLQEIKSPSELASCLFDAQKVPVAARGRHLKTGVNYDVEATIRIMPLARKSSFWTMFNPVSYFDKSVTVGTTYIGR